MHLRELKENKLIIMKKPITRYDMKIYMLLPGKTRVATDLNIELKKIDFGNLREISALRGNTRYREYKKLLNEKKSIGISIYYQGKVIGYGWGKLKGAFDNFYKINKSGYIAGIFVAPEYRGHNIATIIVQSIMEIFYKKYNIENCYASIEKSNISSKHAFEKIGIEMVDSRIIYRVCKVTIPKCDYYKEI